MADMAESYWKTVELQHGGKEYEVTLDSPSASRLLAGDAELTEEIVKTIQETVGGNEQDCNEQFTVASSLAAMPAESAGTSTDEVVHSSNNKVVSVWNGDKSEKGRKQDKSAILQLLHIVGCDKYKEMFKDNKTKKSTIWKQVVSDMRNAGVHLDNDDKAAAHKCDQKYRNLERQYKDFVQHINTTGKGRRDKPEFYEEMGALWGDKHTTRPIALVDTIHSPADMPEPQTRPKPCVAKKRKTKSSEIVDILCKMQKNEHERQGKMTETMEKLTEVLNQRHIQRQQEERAQFHAYVKMHNEKMEMQRKLIEALADKN